ARKHKRQYPETEEEAFDSVRGEKYDADVEDIISEMIKEAKALHLPSRKIRFVHEGSNKYSTAASNRDVMVMYEDVKNDRKYLLVTDGVKTGTDTGAKTASKVCSLIIKIMEPDIKND